MLRNLIVRIMFGKNAGVVVFKSTPTEGDSITVNNMEAVFREECITYLSAWELENNEALKKLG